MLYLNISCNLASIGSPFGIKDSPKRPTITPLGVIGPPSSEKRKGLRGSSNLKGLFILSSLLRKLSPAATLTGVLVGGGGITLLLQEFTLDSKWLLLLHNALAVDAVDDASSGGVFGFPFMR